MYYKAMKDDIVVDVLSNITYVRYQERNNVMLACDRSESQAILTSDGNSFWHVYGQYHLPIGEYDTVELVEICQEEYEQLKSQNGKVV